MLKRSPRAFALILVLLVALAAAAVAVGLTSAGGDARIRSVQSEHADISEGIAHGGLQRLKAYANTVSIAGDYDSLLDPTNAATCGPPPTCGACNRPNFADGIAVTYRGKSYERVTFNGGAYLLRIEDDNDDIQNEAAWAPTTGACENTGVDNPFRDRNRTVVLTSIGISPGLDPDRAQHRTVLRHTLSNNGALVSAGITANGNIDVGGSAELFACSPVSRVQIDGNFVGPGSGTACACGNSLADSLDSWEHCTAVAGACAAVGCAPGALGTPGPALPLPPQVTAAAGLDFYFDWTSPCNVLVDEFAATGTKSLWVWDPTATRGPGNALCSTLAGSGLTLGDATPPDLTANSYRRCWTLLIADINGACLSPWTALGAEGAPAPGCQWTPRNLAATTSIGPLTFNKPDWSLCTVTYPGNTPASCMDGGAGEQCDGSVAVMAEHPGPKPYWFKGDSIGELRAIPAATYLYLGNLDVGSVDMNAPFPADVVAPIQMSGATREFPLTTVIATGNIEGSGRMILGTGVDRPNGARFASVVTNGNMTFTGGGDKSYAGSFYAPTGNLQWGGNVVVHLFGEIHILGNWEMNGSGEYHWFYMTAFSSGGTAAVGLPARMPSFE